MIRILILGLFILFESISGLAQTDTFPRDTTYTVNSTLTKIRKHHKNLEVSAVYSNPSDNITIVNDLIYKEIGERQLKANLFYSKTVNRDNIPVIMMIHGGGWRAGDKSLMTPMAEKFAESGYFVIAPEYRLSLEASYPAGVLDLMDVLNWISNEATHYNIDPMKISILGCSVGGQLAALVGTTYRKSIFSDWDENNEFYINAIVDIDGVLALHHPESQEGKVAAEWLGGAYLEVPAKWEQASALTHVDQNTPPTLFIASSYPRFLAGRNDFISVLDTNKITNDTKFFEDAPHSFWLLNPWFQPTVDYVLSFLNEIEKSE